MTTELLESAHLSSLSLPSHEVTGIAMAPSFYTCAGQPNSDPCGFLVNSLPNESSPQLLILQYTYTYIIAKNLGMMAHPFNLSICTWKQRQGDLCELPARQGNIMSLSKKKKKNCFNWRDSSSCLFMITWTDMKFSTQTFLKVCI